MRAADVAFYGASGAVIAMLGSLPGAQAARLPLAALLLCNWAAEHQLLTTFERFASYLTKCWSRRLRGRLTTDKTPPTLRIHMVEWEGSQPLEPSGYRVTLSQIHI